MAAKKKYDRTKQKETLVKVLEYIKHYRAVLVFSLILAGKAGTVKCRTGRDPDKYGKAYQQSGRTG